MLPEHVFKYIIRVEGGYVNHPADPGGATKWGITQATYRFAGYEGHVSEMTEEQCMEIYDRYYWQPLKLDMVWKRNPALALILFDTTVNHGIRQAVRFLQEGLNLLGHSLEVDGKFGTNTREAFEADCENGALGLLIVGMRLFFYKSLSTWPTFGKGWTNRLRNLMTMILGCTDD